MVEMRPDLDSARYISLREHARPRSMPIHVRSFIATVDDLRQVIAAMRDICSQVRRNMVQTARKMHYSDFIFGESTECSRVRAGRLLDILPPALPELLQPHALADWYPSAYLDFVGFL
jgi:hypothetical protein